MVFCRRRRHGTTIYVATLLLLFVQFDVSGGFSHRKFPTQKSQFRRFRHAEAMTRILPSQFSLHILCAVDQRQDEKCVKRLDGIDSSGKSFFSDWRSAAASCLLLVLMSLTTDACWAAQEGTGSPSMRYWDIMKHGPTELVTQANEGLVDYAVRTVNTMYYDNSGGAYFEPQDFYSRWKFVRNFARDKHKDPAVAKFSQRNNVPADIAFDSRENAVRGLKWLISTINDPFSKYLTRDELRQELQVSDNHGFLGLGAIVEPPALNQKAPIWGPLGQQPLAAQVLQKQLVYANKKQPPLLSITQASNLPMVTAVCPDSPAERSGVIVGDRIVAVGSDNFLGQTRTAVTKALQSRYNAENYIGYPEVTIAKPLVVAADNKETSEVEEEVLIGYRLSRVKLPTTLVEPFHLYPTPEGVTSGGDAIVHYELLTPQDSIFDRPETSLSTHERVGYIRLTRFSRASTAGYLHAVSELEAAGAQSYIIDLRNNYGGIIQEAMLTASTLLRDPHLILCYTMNNRGGFMPHEVAEFILDERFPGYLLSSESKSVTLNQVKRESPEFLDKDGGFKFVPPSSYASLHEQSVKRGIHIATSMTAASSATASQRNVALPFSSPLNTQAAQMRAQKKVVILINEGTASSAEVFASALRDNGRTAALVGAKSYGKGLIQHTFPMPDGGGLRLTVAEYLTPTLQHVTHVGNARFDRTTGEWVGGGIRPDISCDSRQGIPSDIGADLCVGVALDALEDAASPLGDGGSI